MGSRWCAAGQAEASLGGGQDNAETCVIYGVSTL